MPRIRPEPVATDDGEIDALAKVLREGHDLYSRANWDFWMYQWMARAALVAGYRLTPQPFSADGPGPA